MKKVIRVISSIVIVFSFVFLLYGTIKLFRVDEAAKNIQNIDIGIAGVQIVQPSKIISKENTQVIIGISAVTLVMGIVCYFFFRSGEFAINSVLPVETVDGISGSDSETVQESGKVITSSTTPPAATPGVEE